MRISDYIRNNRDDYTFDDDGNMRITIDSAMLPGLSIDTYSTFPTDVKEEDYLDGINSDIEDAIGFSHPMIESADITLDMDHVDFGTDMEGYLHGLAEAVVSAVTDEFPFIEGAKVLSVYSPKEYNFSTDSFSAKWTINVEKMIEWIGDEDVEDIEAWARERYASRSGFVSRIPTYFRERYSWAIVWAYITRAFTESDFDSFDAVLDGWHNAWEWNTLATVNHNGYAYIGEMVLGKSGIGSSEMLLAALPDYQED